nr:MAG TPA: hypothetical protein [Caudoviricetes sp.]
MIRCSPVRSQMETETRCRMQGHSFAKTYIA